MWFRAVVAVVLAVLLSFLNTFDAFALPGDIDSSGRVDGSDLITLGRANGTVKDDADWNPDADLDNNGIINTDDVDILSTHFGNSGLSFGLWVADRLSGNQRLAKVSDNGHFLLRKGEYSSPLALTPDFNDGTVWVGDAESDLIRKISGSTGETILTVYGLTPSALSLNFKDRSLWITDDPNNQVVQLSPSVPDGYDVSTDTGSHITVTGFSSPQGISVHDSGTVWVADTYHNQIVRLQAGIPDGYNIDTETGHHTVLAGFSSPKDLKVDQTDGTVWIADTGADRIVKYDKNGTTKIFELGGFAYVEAIAVNFMDGSVWIADTGNGRITRLDAEGALIHTTDAVSNPFSLDINPLDGSCWVADKNNSQLVKLAPDGTELLRTDGVAAPVTLAVSPIAYYPASSPVAEAATDAYTVEPGVQVAFTGTGYDPDGSIILHEWDFNGDSVYDFSSENNGAAEHSYPDAGIYNAVFRVTDNSYQQAADYSTIIRVGRLTATATADLTSGTAPLIVHFSGSYNDPIDGFVDSFQWDLDGDGTFDSYSETTSDIVHTFSDAGTYTINLKVTDGAFADISDSLTITVQQATPTVQLSAVPSSGQVPLHVDFSAATDDPDGRIVLYQWDMDGDGTYDLHSTTDDIASYVYTTVGQYNATVRITDNDGNTEIGSVLIDAGSVPPVAQIDADTVRGHGPLSVHFAATGSYDPNGSIVTYEWNFEEECSNNIVFNDDMEGGSSSWSAEFPWELITSDSRSPSTSWTDSSSGNYQDSINTALTSRPVTGKLSNSGTLTFWHHYATENGYDSGYVEISSDAGLTWSQVAEYTGTLSSWTEEQLSLDQFLPANDLRVRFRLDTDGSGAEDGWYIDDVQIEQCILQWTLSPDGTADHVYTAPGNYTATLRITDNEGNVSFKQIQITVLEGDTPSVSVAADTTHGTVPLTVNFSGSAQYPNGSISEYQWNFGEEFVWVADSSDNQVIRMIQDGSGELLRSAMDDPVDVAVDHTDGTLWIAERSSDRVVHLTADGSTELAVIDGFNYPIALALNPLDSTVWVADYYHHQVVHIDPSGKELSRTSGFNYPVDVAVNNSDNSVWIADRSNDQIVKLSAAGEELARISGFNDPYAVSVNSGTEHVWVADYYNHQVVRFDSSLNGNYDISTDTGHHQAIPGFSYPISVSVNSTDHTVWIADKGHNQIVQLDATGTELLRLDDFSSPMSVSVDPASGICWVADSGHDQMVKLAANGEELARLGGFSYPGVVAVVSRPGNTSTSTTTGDTSHTYTVPGLYHPVMTAITNDGKTSSAGLDIRADGVPSLNIRADHTSGPAPHEVFFSSAVTEKDGRIVQYDWDFDNDALVDLSSDTASSARYIYEQAGNFTAKLQITDDDGYTTEDSIPITVIGAPPTVSTDFAPSIGNAPLTVLFSGSASDNDGSVVLYEWDFTNDGTFDSNSAVNAEAAHTYTVADEYTAVLRVTDNDGLQKSAKVRITVLPSGTPRAVLEADPTHGTVPMTVSFCIQGDDPDGTVENYAIDFDGNGSYDATFTSPPTAFYDNLEHGFDVWTADAPWAVTHDEAVSGSYALTDSPDGNYADNTDLSITSPTIDLSTADDPWLTFHHKYDIRSGDYARVEISENNGVSWSRIGYYSNQTKNKWTQAQYDLSSYRGNALIKIRFRLLSNSADTGDGWSIDDVRVGDCGVRHTYTTAGRYNAVLRVTDNDGKQNTEAASIAVYAPENSSIVWGVDTGHGQVVKLSRQGEELARVSGFSSPRSAVVDPANGDVWIADTGHDQVIKLDAAVQHNYSIAYKRVADAVPDGHAGKVLGDTALVTGKISSGMQFDGNGDYITIPNSQRHRTNSWTLEAWVKPASFDSINTIFGKVGQSKDFALVLNNNQLGVLIYDSGRKNLLDPSHAVLNQWYHVAASFDDSTHTLNLYVDGVLVNSTNEWSSAQFNTDDLTIGKSLCCSEYFNGLIDEVRFWNTVRTQAEIAGSMNSALTGNEPGLTAYYPLDQFSVQHQAVTGFHDPYYLATDAADSSVWVTDYNNNQVVKLAQNGTELLRLDDFYRPRRLALCESDQSIWVSDSGHDQMVHLDKNGNLLSRLDGFDNPIGVAVDQRDCSVWIADYYHNQVVKLDPTGSELVRRGNFNGPGSISVNADNGNVWVADYGHHQIVKLTDTGLEITRLDNFAYPYDVKVSQQDGTVWVADKNNNAFVQLAPDGNERIRINDFSYPLSLALDKGTRLLTHPPSAAAAVNPQSGEASLTVNFDNSGSTDDSVLSKYEWDFDGDMLFDYASSTPGTTTHTYSAPGIYTPILRVTDDTGLMDYDSTHTIYVTDLTVEASAEPTAGIAPLDVEFNARVTGLTPERTITSYEWDVDNDGIIDYTSNSTPERSHEYPDSGIFTAVLKITDSENATAFGSVTVSVAPGTPSANASVSPSSGELPLGVSLSGSGNDPDGSIVLYEWDYDGDGIFDWFSDENADTYFTYSEAGSYSPTLRVTDNEGFTAVDAASLTVTESMVLPSVTAQADKKKGHAPLSVHFSGTAQDPDDNSITAYAWDFDGDGTWEYNSADSAATDHTFTVPGEYTAILRVTDSDGLTATDTVSIKILYSGVPDAVIQTDVTQGKAPLSVQFDGSASSDPDGTIVQYQWNFGNTQVWVGDTNNNRVKTVVGPKLIDVFSGFENPNRILVDQDEETIWVTKDNENGVVKLSADGRELVRADNFSDPRGIALDQSDHSVWITDFSHQQLVHLDSNGIELARLNGFNKPYGVAVDKKDRSVWVSDATDDQIVRLDVNGNETGRFFGFDEPGWITHDPADRSFLIADRLNNRIVRLAHDTPDGYLLSTDKLTDDETDTAQGMLINNAEGIAGRLNNALSLNGSNGYLLLPKNSAHDLQSFTFETWWQSSDVTNRALFMRGDNSGNNEILILFTSSTQIKVFINNTTYYFDGSGNFTDDTWHHMAVVHDADADTLTCYVDGTQYGAVADSGDVILDFGNSNTLIGADYDAFNGSLGNYFLGSLDDTRLWSIARSAAEIVSNKDSELTGTEPGLAGYWPMNEIVDTPYHTVRNGFNTPTCIDIDPFDQSVWVCDYNNSQMVKLTPSFDREISRVSGFDRPFAAAVDPVDGTVWIADQYHSQIVQLAQDGTELQRLSGFNRPLAVGLLNAAENTVTLPDDTPVSHVFPADGKYPVTLTVTDDSSNSDRDSVMITVGGPESLPTVYPLSGQTPLEVRFSANGTCANCTLENFAYDFDGNGSIDWATTISDTNTHTYHHPGTYTVTQKVTGNDGLTDTASITVTVLPTDGIPDAEAFADPDEGVGPLTVTLTGLGRDLDGFIKKYEWDFNNDGVFDFTSAGNGVIEHEYTETGTHTALFRVTDDEGNTDTATVHITVKAPGAPTAHAAADPAHGATTLDVSLTGTGTDTDGSIVLYEWDFDGDGIFDWSLPTSGAVSHNYALPGTFAATLRVTDNEGMTDTDVVHITASMQLTASLGSDMLDPGNQESVSINSVLTGEATVTVKITDRNGALVRTLIDSKIRQAGYYTDVWDGRNESNNIVASGVYLYIIEYSVNGVNYVYDLTNSAESYRKAPSVTYPASFDPFSADANFFRYTLDHKGDITVYISHFSQDTLAGARVKTLLLRYPQTAGSYVQVWDGTDDQGKLVDPTSYVIAVFSWDLPDNAIIVRSEPVINDLYIHPAYVNPAALPYDETDSVEIIYTLSKQAKVVASVFDKEGYLIRTLTQPNVPAGPLNTMEWDGKNETGKYVAPGSYRIKLVATDAAGNSSMAVNAPAIIFY